MPKQHPTTQTLDAADARQRFDDLLDAVDRAATRVVVEKDGKPIAAIISTADLNRLDRLDAQREADFSIIDEVRAAFAGVPDEEIERETDRILGVNRDEHQAVGSAARER